MIKQRSFDGDGGMECCAIVCFDGDGGKECCAIVIRCLMLCHHGLCHVGCARMAGQRFLIKCFFGRGGRSYGVILHPGFSCVHRLWVVLCYLLVILLQPAALTTITAT